VKIPAMIKNVGDTGERVVVRGEVDGKIIFYNYLDDEDCVVENLRPGMRLIVELEKQ
jgi:hypothetical protein